MKNIYKIECKKCKKVQILDKPFSSDLKDNNERYIICDKCKEKIFYQFKNNENKKLPIFLKTINIKTR